MSNAATKRLPHAELDIARLKAVAGRLGFAPWEIKELADTYSLAEVGDSNEYRASSATDKTTS